jgi:7-carboxy-7-deazaguanine synthase
LCGFLRLGGCNLSCRWCDTPYTWDWKGIASSIAYSPADELHPKPVAEVHDRLRTLGVELVIVSGGEPLNQQRRLTALLPLLTADGITVEIETNGTRAPNPELTRWVRRYVVSPKLSHAGDSVERRIVPTALAAFERSGKAAYKFVVQSVANLDEVAEIVQGNRLTNIWIMPEGRRRESVLRTMSEIADAVVERRWNLTSRLHVLAWDDRRGV